MTDFVPDGACFGTEITCRAAKSLNGFEIYYENMLSLDMENIAEILKRVLSTQLIAPSIAELAVSLGYKGRSSVYRILNGTASERAVAHLCSKLNEILYIDENCLVGMESTISNTYHFSRLMRNYTGTLDGETVFEVVRCFVTHDYTTLPEEFITNELDELLNIERTYTEEFYNMLAYFYVRHSVKNFYQKGLTHRERCAAVMEPLGERFVKLFPENGLAVNMVYSYSRSDLFNGEIPVLWSLIQSISAMLRFFSRPLETLRSDNSIRFLPGLQKREYWECKDSDVVALTWAKPNINGSSGSYEVFGIERESGRIEKLCVITILSENILSLYSVDTGKAQLGVYAWDGKTISLDWEKADDDPTKLGNTWTRLESRHSQSVRMLDRTISDEMLSLEVLRKEGFTDIMGYSVRDVIISRERIRLLLENGLSYSIDNSHAPFLNQITPSDAVMILKRNSDDEIFVFWTDLMHCLPLSLFAKEC